MLEPLQSIRLPEIEDPFTGQRIAFRSTGGEGEPMQVDLFLRPGGYVCTHVHPNQEERFVGIEGEFRFRIGRRRITLRAGDEVVAHPGVPHRFDNRSDAEAHMLVEVTPAWPVDSVLLLIALCRDGRVRMPRYGVPRPLLQIAVLGEHYLDEVCLPYVPLSLQRAVFRALGPVGRALGYRGTFPEYAVARLSERAAPSHSSASPSPS